MAALLEASTIPNPSLFPSLSHPLQNLKPTSSPPKPLSLSLLSPSKPCICSSARQTLEEDPEPPPENPNPRTNSVGGPPNVRKDRRRAVRIAWEKLVRWSRSWRSKARADVLERTKKVVVLGGGSFGTAMAAHIAGNKAEMEVNMLVRDAHICQSINKSHYNYKYFPDDRLPNNITATTDAKAALLGADFCLHAVPVQFSSSFLEGISQHVDPKLPFISLSKGLELNTLRMMSQIIPQSLGNPGQPFVALSGPSFALELMRKLPTGHLQTYQKSQNNHYGFMLWWIRHHMLDLNRHDLTIRRPCRSHMALLSQDFQVIAATSSWFRGWGDGSYT